MPSRVLAALLACSTASLASSVLAQPQQSDPALDATTSRCFELRSSQPDAAIALAEETLRGEDVPADAEIKLQACLGRAAALAGDTARATASVARIDALLRAHPMPPEFALRALSNAGATLHTVGHVHEALDFYARAYEAARRDESQIAQVATLINVAIIHSEELGALDVAEGFYEQAQGIQATIGGSDPLLAYNRGLNYLRMGREAAAAAEFETAAAQAQAAGQDIVAQRTLAERTALAARSAPAAAPLRALEDIVRRQQALQDPSGAAITLTRLSQLRLLHGDPRAALAHARAASTLVGGDAFRRERHDALQAEVSAQRALGRWQEALQGTQALREMEIERLRSQTLAGLAELQARLQDARSTQELEQLRDERRIEGLRLSHARRLRNAAIGAFCLLALLAGAFVLYQRRVNRTLHRLSNVDALTGLLNRRAAGRQLQVGEADPTSGERRGVVFLIDVDHFKAHNDRHGHAAGDAILAATAAQLRAVCRPEDVVARWGGEEFLVGCRQLDVAQASTVAERLRTAVAGAPGDTQAGGRGGISVSIGFACHPFLPGSAASGGWQEAITLADRALYAAKRGGRDAWVGLWGHAHRQATVESVLADPERHAALGDITVLSSRPPVDWPAAPRPPGQVD